MPYSQPNEAPTLSDLFSLKGKNALVIGGSGQYCDQDVDRDGQVGYTELIDLMSNWGLTDL